MTKLTKEGLEKLQEELEELEGEGRKKVAAELNHAASFGDLKENASYDAAKNKQAFLEARVAELKNIVKNAEVVTKITTDKVQIGSTVIVKTNQEEKNFQVVGPDEADPMSGKISYESPIGEALIEKTLGTKVKVQLPAGEKEFEIISIE